MTTESRILEVSGRPTNQEFFWWDVINADFALGRGTLDDYVVDRHLLTIDVLY